MKGVILLVDDQKAVVKLVSSMLEKEGYRLRHAETADAAIALLRREKVDLAILDIGLPGVSGLQLLELMRKEPGTVHLPVMMLTVLGEESHKVAGLRAGADDYLAKPFSAQELLARVEALLRRIRRQQAPGNVLAGGEVSVDLDRRQVRVRGGRVSLRPLEFNLLVVLMRRKGFVLSYATLSESLSEGSKLMSSGNLYVHVKSLRDALGQAGRLIETVHGVGYRFIEED